MPQARCRAAAAASARRRRNANNYDADDQERPADRRQPQLQPVQPHDLGVAAAVPLAEHDRATTRPRSRSRRPTTCCASRSRTSSSASPSPTSTCCSPSSTSSSPRRRRRRCPSSSRRPSATSRSAWRRSSTPTKRRRSTTRSWRRRSRRATSYDNRLHGAARDHRPHAQRAQEASAPVSSRRSAEPELARLLGRARARARTSTVRVAQYQLRHRHARGRPCARRPLPDGRPGRQLRRPGVERRGSSERLSAATPAAALIGVALNAADLPGRRDQFARARGGRAAGAVARRTSRRAPQRAVQRRRSATPGVTSAVAAVKAFEQAVVSAQVGARFEPARAWRSACAPTSTCSNVQQNVFSTRRDLAQAYFNYLIGFAAAEGGGRLADRRRPRGDQPPAAGLIRQLTGCLRAARRVRPWGGPAVSQDCLRAARSGVRPWGGPAVSRPRPARERRVDRRLEPGPQPVGRAAVRGVEREAPPRPSPPARSVREQRGPLRRPARRRPRTPIAAPAVDRGGRRRRRS